MCGDQPATMIFRSLSYCDIKFWQWGDVKKYSFLPLILTISLECGQALNNGLRFLVSRKVTKSNASPMKNFACLDILLVTTRQYLLLEDMIILKRYGCVNSSRNLKVILHKNYRLGKGMKRLDPQIYSPSCQCLLDYVRNYTSR